VNDKSEKDVVVGRRRDVRSKIPSTFSRANRFGLSSVQFQKHCKLVIYVPQL